MNSRKENGNSVNKLKDRNVSESRVNALYNNLGDKNSSDRRRPEETNRSSSRTDARWKSHGCLRTLA